jgi:hypothetical protein
MFVVEDNCDPAILMAHGIIFHLNGQATIISLSSVVAIAVSINTTNF